VRAWSPSTRFWSYRLVVRRGWETLSPFSRTCCGAGTCPRNASERWRRTTLTLEVSHPSTPRTALSWSACEKHSEHGDLRCPSISGIGTGVDTLRTMRESGVRRALAFVTSAFGSYSGCRQYTEDIARARAEVGNGAPEVVRLRSFFNHPSFVEACADRVDAAFHRIPDALAPASLVFTAHSIPLSMAAASPYLERLRETCRLTAERAGRTPWDLVWQSRSGPASQPWLEPDVGAHLEMLHQQGVRSAVVAPVGFLSDHLEVVWDLDTDLQQRARRLGLHVERAGTVGTHPSFVSMVVDLVGERLTNAPRRAIGVLPPPGDACPADCCPAPSRPAVR
jgi:ferrochelatase